MYKKLIATILTLCSLATLAAQEQHKVLTGFSGGMMVHAGWATTPQMPVGYTASGFVYGIGGVLRLHLGNHLRLGTEGYVSTMPQRPDRSYVKCGWGGLLADVCFKKGRFYPFVGLTVGGGSLSTLLVRDGDPSDWEYETQVLYRKRAFVAVDPFVGCEYALTDFFHLSLKVDCLCGFGRSLSFPVGPRFYIGAIFYH